MSANVQQNPDARSTELWTTGLMFASFACWLISLMLPAFLVDGTGDLMVGLEALFFGTLFGWVVRGWAAYANLFFVIATIRLMTGGQPCKSVVVMLALAATLPAFQGAIISEGASASPVVSWGWGAFLWIVSLLLCTLAAAVRAGKVKTAGALASLALLIACAVGIHELNLHQRRLANERKRPTLPSSTRA